MVRHAFLQSENVFESGGTWTKTSFYGNVHLPLTEKKGERERSKIQKENSKTRTFPRVDLTQILRELGAGSYSKTQNVSLLTKNIAKENSILLSFPETTVSTNFLKCYYIFSATFCSVALTALLKPRQ